MKAYVVGGAVRDQLMGVPSNDRDWVVVGATPEQMVAAGFTPVGRDFPVFLHPQTHEEYALARTERKSGAGYHGFVFHTAPDVTLEQDLARRDLTINAMALDPDTGALVDPFGGAADVRAGVLRHVSDAFAEDPVRLLRVARFAARWPRFAVADTTRALMRRLVQTGEVDALVAERSWQEVARGLAEPKPSRMIAVLRDSGAWARLAPELDAWCADDAARHAALMRVLVDCPPPSPLRFACLCHGLPLAKIQALCERWRVDNDSRELAQMVAREWPTLHRAAELTAVVALELLERSDAWRRPERVRTGLSVLRALASMGSDATPVHQRCERIERALQAALQVSVASLPADVRAASGHGPALGRALRDGRERAIAAAIAEP
ncbi:MAG TPA: multifunctional CCA tRNA nucleotidyl transferase/2'3'-cyclic phosphodiesterase/2'nucleotidase/phosphatase [Burkholderiaceae bacterium]|nr:multifunctional CCA tRNA nucleotidyl transferase/2'3'-cyclic phosphodiesterase/2'nucleotidase/phosphatase [Burkholderiaceae bacterium]